MEPDFRILGLGAGLAGWHRGLGSAAMRLARAGFGTLLSITLRLVGWGWRLKIDGLRGFKVAQKHATSIYISLVLSCMFRQKTQLKLLPKRKEGLGLGFRA